MDLFTPIVSEDKLNPNFKNILGPSRATARELLAQWAKGFQDRDGKLVKEFQTTFNSTFWEIYLYAVLKEYGFAINWNYAAPDFLVEHPKNSFCIEAVTANAAFGKTQEWELSPTEKLKSPPSSNEVNHEAMIRLANALISKSRKYNNSYQKLEHVRNRPFIIAVAGFEQPHFMLQYDRPIRAVLYDYYVDEDAYRANPSLQLLTDGLQIYHNPHARIPLDYSLFRKEGVVQHYYDKFHNDWVYEEMQNCLCFRLINTLTGSDKNVSCKLSLPTLL